jgi:hypothetical protein
MLLLLKPQLLLIPLRLNFEGLPLRFGNYPKQFS